MACFFMDAINSGLGQEVGESFPKPCGARDGGTERTWKYSQRVSESSPPPPGLRQSIDVLSAQDSLQTGSHCPEFRQSAYAGSTPGHPGDPVCSSL